MLTQGMLAPNFTLPAADGTMVSLSSFLGKTVVLYFYPKDNTSGCTRQACAFAALNAAFSAKNAVVIGISKDSSASHQKFAEKHALPFLLLTDADHAVMEAYGVWQKKKMCGKVGMGTVRTTFIIDAQGKIARIMPKVKPDTNAQTVLELLDT